jgi:hypothetical protein
MTMRELRLRVRAATIGLSIFIHTGLFFSISAAFSVQSLLSQYRCRHVQHGVPNDKAAMIEYDDFLPNPHADLEAIQVVEACMNTMLHRKEAGLEVCWNFSSDRCRVRSSFFVRLVVCLLFREYKEHDACLELSWGIPVILLQSALDYASQTDTLALITFGLQASLGGSLEAFLKFSTNPVFSHLVKCKDWKTISIGPVIQGTPTRGAMQTVLIDVMVDGATSTDSWDLASKNDDLNIPTQARRFLWTLQRERRPPQQGCYLVHECIYVRNAYDLTL